MKRTENSSGFGRIEAAHICVESSIRKDGGKRQVIEVRLELEQWRECIWLTPTRGQLEGEWRDVAGSTLHSVHMEMT